MGRRWWRGVHLEVVLLALHCLQRLTVERKERFDNDDGIVEKYFESTRLLQWYRFRYLEVALT